MRDNFLRERRDIENAAAAAAASVDVEEAEEIFMMGGEQIDPTLEREIDAEGEWDVDGFERCGTRRHCDRTWIVT